MSSGDTDDLFSFFDQPPADLAHLPAPEPSATADLERRIAALEYEVRCLVRRVIEAEARAANNEPMQSTNAESMPQTEISMQAEEPTTKSSVAVSNRLCLICNSAYDPHHPRQHYKSRRHGANVNYALVSVTPPAGPIFCSLQCKMRAPRPCLWSTPDEAPVLLDKTIHWRKEFGSFYVCLVCGGAINLSCMLEKKPTHAPY